MIWERSHKYDPPAVALADRHYNREKPGTPQFVAPGRSLVLLTRDRRAVWVTSWPQFARHRWRGAWINTLFRREGGAQGRAASDMILAAVAATRARWPNVPEGGMVTFVDPDCVEGVRVRGKRVFGFCYLKAGFEHVGFTDVYRLWVWQLRPDRMPPAEHAIGAQLELV